MPDTELQNWVPARNDSDDRVDELAIVRQRRADLNAFSKEVLGRAAQYDLRLSGRATMDSQVVFTWRWHGHYLWRDFESRQEAIDWMVEWLATETRAQQLPYFSRLPEHTSH